MLEGTRRGDAETDAVSLHLDLYCARALRDGADVVGVLEIRMGCRHWDETGGHVADVLEYI